MGKKKGDKGKLTNVEKELIYQTFLVLNNKTRTAEDRNVSVQTVRRVIKEITEANDVATVTKEDRAQVASRLQSRIHKHANELLDSISPEDLESGQIKIRDADGNIVKVIQYGPSLLQKMTSFGIIVDKANVALTYEKVLTDATGSGELMLPGDIAGLQNAITGTIKELKFLNVRFEHENPSLVTEVQEAIIVEKPESLDDEFDNPK